MGPSAEAGPSASVWVPVLTLAWVFVNKQDKKGSTFTSATLTDIDLVIHAEQLQMISEAKAMAHLNVA